MKPLIEATVGLFALGAPVILAGIGVALSERSDGRTRLVIVGGRVRRRASLTKS